MRFVLYMALAGIILVLDQGTKQIAYQTLLGQPPVDILPVLQFVLVFNKGAAFGFLSDQGGWQVYLFSGLAILVAIGIPIWIWKICHFNTTLSLGLALVLGGALGNLIDRLQYQYVIDFISVYYNSWYFPAFNVADIAISLGAFCLILDAIFPASPQTATE